MGYLSIPNHSLPSVGYDTLVGQAGLDAARVESALQNSVMDSLKWGSLGTIKLLLPEKKVNACGSGKKPTKEKCVKARRGLKRVINAMVREDGVP